MTEDNEDLIKNGDKGANEARNENATKEGEQDVKIEGNAPEKRKKNLLPTILIIAIPLIIIGLAILFFGTGSSNTSTLGNNIDENALNIVSGNSQTIELTGSTKITQPGVYTLTGTIENGMISINTNGVVQLILNGVNITNNNGPAIYVENAKTVIVETAEGSTNILTDSPTYSGWDEDVCGALFSHDDLVLQGSGTLVVNGNFEDGIVGKDDLKIISGTYIVDSRDEGIRGRDSVYIVDGNFEIDAGGDAIKANNSDEVAKGWVKIDGGKIVARAGDDGIHAESSLEINGGDISIEKSYEGLEAAKITINGGEISVYTDDDGLNAAGGNDSSSPNMARYQESSSDYAIYINGGKIYVNSMGDGIDSNGALYINDGIVIVDGPTNSANGALDSETGIIYKGGTVVAVGASGMVAVPGNSSTNYSMSVFFTQNYAAGTKISVRKSNGTTIFEHTSAKSFQHAVLGSDEFENGETYHIYINDEEYTSVTLSGTTTQVGNGGGMMPGGGGQQMPGRRM